MTPKTETYYKPISYYGLYLIEENTALQYFEPVTVHVAEDLYRKVNKTLTLRQAEDLGEDCVRSDNICLTSLPAQYHFNVYEKVTHVLPMVQDSGLRVDDSKISGEPLEITGKFERVETSDDCENKWLNYPDKMEIQRLEDENRELKTEVALEWERKFKEAQDAWKIADQVNDEIYDCTKSSHRIDEILKALTQVRDAQENKLKIAKEGIEWAINNYEYGVKDGLKECLEKVKS